MSPNWHIGNALTAVLLFSIAVMAQTRETPPVSSVFAVLANSLESKSATVGQKVVLRLVSDVVVDGEIVIPREARVLGHVSEALANGKNRSKSALAIVIDKAVKKDGSEIRVQAIIAAVAAPKPSSLSSDPTYGMLHSNEPKMSGAGAAA